MVGSRASSTVALPLGKWQRVGGFLLCTLLAAGYFQGSWRTEAREMPLFQVDAFLRRRKNSRPDPVRKDLTAPVLLVMRTAPMVQESLGMRHEDMSCGDSFVGTTASLRHNCRGTTRSYCIVIAKYEKRWKEKMAAGGAGCAALAEKEFHIARPALPCARKERSHNRHLDRDQAVDTGGQSRKQPTG